MEPKELTPQQSLQVIEQMIQATNRRVTTHGGIQFLIWGYTTVFTSLLVYFLDPIIGWNATYLWSLIPIVGGLLTWLDRRKRAKQSYSRSQIDYMLHVVWAVVGVNTLICSYTLGFFALIAIVMLITSGTAITGFVLRIRVLQICSILGYVLLYGSIVLEMLYPDLIGSIDYYLLFALIFFIINCIPGHYLYSITSREVKKQNEERGV